MFEMKCIVAIVERGRANKVVDAAKKAGAAGATIFYGRGSGQSEVKKFLNVSVEDAKEVILIISKAEEISPIVDAMSIAGKIEEAGTGIVFTVPVTNLLGLNHRDTFIGDEQVDND